jgi:hypothetical protein
MGNIMSYGTLGIDTIQSSTTGTPTQFQDGSGTKIGTLCRAWVNFNGSTGTIRNSFNVSLLTKNTTGDYTINFTTAMPDANYAWSSSCNNSDDSSSNGNSGTVNTTVALQTASSLRVQTRYQVTTVSGIADLTLVTVAVFSS